jgi:chromosome partitioning protein
MHMLDWFKRIAAPARGEGLTQQDNQTLVDERKVEQLVGRLASAGSRAHDVLLSTRMPAPVVVVSSQKGGSGKTTISAHLAVQAGLAGDGPAVLVDSDPQGSLTEWWRARKDDALALATVRPDELAADPAELRRRRAAVTIIDTPPALTTAIEQVIALADLVIIPARPSPHDLRAVGGTIDITRKAGKPFLFVVNGATPRANITAETIAALSEHGPVAPVILYQRIEYASSMTGGLTVMETGPNGRSAHEIAQLWKFVHARIGFRAAA